MQQPSVRSEDIETRLVTCTAGADEQCDDNAVRSTAAVDCRSTQICALRRVPVACPLELLVERVEPVSRSNEQHGVVPLARCRVKDADVRRHSDELTRGREYQYMAGTAQPHEIPVAITAGDSEDVSQLASQLNCAPHLSCYCVEEKQPLGALGDHRLRAALARQDREVSHGGELRVVSPDHLAVAAEESKCRFPP